MNATNTDPEVGNEEPVVVPDEAPVGAIPAVADQSDRLRSLGLGNQHTGGRPFGK